MIKALHPPSAQAPSGGPVSQGLRPTLAELVALRPLARTRPARRARSGARALAPSPMRGQGMEYAESREYVAGDDARHIDWRVTARSGRPHTKTFQRERERLSLVVADTSPALYFGTRVRFKSVQAARAGAIAAWAACADGDRIAALRGSRTEAPVAPGAGMRGALRVLEALSRWYADVPAEDAGLETAIRQARRLLRPGSRLLVLADAASIGRVPSSDWAAVGAHCEALVLLLEDRLEHCPPQARLGFSTPGGRVELDLAGAGAVRWRGHFQAAREAAVQRLRSAGVGVESLAADAFSEAWLGAFAGRRA